MDLSRRPRPNHQDHVECWDDDGDIGGFENLQFRNASSTTTATFQSSSKVTHHRDSTGSRISVRSDLDDEGDWQLLLPDDTEAATKVAVENAKKKGIPLPANVPSSALVGGTIRKLGGKKISKAMIRDDWGEDIEMPKPGNGGLKLKMNYENDFPLSLRQVSATAPLDAHSTSQGMGSVSFIQRLKAAGPNHVLEKFKDASENDLFADDMPTIKVAKNRQPLKLPDFPDSSNRSTGAHTESFETDLQLPVDGALKLSARKETPKATHAQVFDEVDTEWAEGSQGSLGTSFGGTRRTGKSARSSSISARSPSVFSPSLSSCLTAESEDEGLEGLVLPEGPLKLDEALKNRLHDSLPESTEPMKVEIRSPTKDDFFDGIDLGHGELFDSGKATVNRNIKYKTDRQLSPTRRAATSLTFTSKLPASHTRIPKPRPKLEPVLESSVPSNYHTSQSRLGNHSTQSSISTIPTPTSSALPSASGPSTPRKLTGRKSRDVLRSEPGNSATAKLLKTKRSLPVMNNKAPGSPARPPVSHPRPPSRSDVYKGPTIGPSRPKTPVDRSESSLSQSRKPPIPHLPFSTATTQTHHRLAGRTTRPFHRPTSSDSTSNENLSLNTRSLSRLSDQYRAGTPTNRRNAASERLVKAAAAKKQVTKPLRGHGFGDGSELDAFDDLPTSAATEAKFIRQPTGSLRGNTTSRSKLYSASNHSTASLSRGETTPRQPLSPQKSDHNLPSFARSTAASRLAREQRLGPSHPQPIRQPSAAEAREHPTTNWKAVVNSKPLASPRYAKRNAKQPKKPQLIKPLGNSASESKTVNGMHWNPQLFRWDGNENALAPFDVPCSPKRAGLSPINKPALIANPGSVKGIQVVGGMVFDPEKMCWLKLAPNSRGRSESTVASITTDEDEEDPFAGIEDLDDETKSKTGPTLHGKSSLSDDEPIVGEEFDVGPEFVRRQEKEEDKWRRKLQGWTTILGQPDRILDARNDIRALVARQRQLYNSMSAQ